MESDPIKSEKIRSKTWDNVPFFLTRIIWDSRQIKCGMKDFGEKSPAFITNEYRHCASIKSLLRTNSLHRKKTEKTSQSRATNNEKQSKILLHQTRSLSKQWKTTAQWPTESKQGDQVHFILRWCPTFMSGYSFSKDRHFWHTLIKSGFHPAAVKRQQEGCHHGVVFCCKSNKLHKRGWK